MHLDSQIGLLTVTLRQRVMQMEMLKVKRKVVEEKWREQIEALYRDQ